MKEMDHMNMDHEDMKNMDHMDMQGMDHDQMNMGGHMMHMGNLKLKFWISLVLAIPIVLMTPMMGINLPLQFTFPGSDWVVALIGTGLFFYGGKTFLDSAKMELADKKPAMMTLIAMGITVAYLYSLYAVVMNNLVDPSHHVMDFFWELATLIVIMLLGHWIEMNAVMSAGDAVQKLAQLLPKQAHIVRENKEIEDIDLTNVHVGDILLVKGNETIPADGTIISGKTSVDEAMITGESKQVEKVVDDEVVGGSVNGNGEIQMTVTGTGETGYLAQVVKLVTKAQSEKSDTETLADKVAGYLFYAAMTVGILAFIVWLITGTFSQALSILVTVLVIACPHALGLAIPLVVARSTSLSAKNGLLIKNRNALEVAHTIDTLLVDKTGTLTEGHFVVTGYKTFTDQFSESEIIGLMASLERGSTHPLGKGIIQKAEDLKIEIPTASETQQINGVGLEGHINDDAFKIVSEAYVNKQQLLTDEMASDNEGDSISYLIQNEKVIGYVAQGDQIKPESFGLVEKLEKMNIKVIMLTGDNQQAADKVGAKLGIVDVRANLMPEDKAKIVSQLEGEGHNVIMVGDGINDAPSLASATIGMAIGSGTDVAVDSADVILVKSNPMDIIKFLKLSRNTRLKMIQNLWWGAGYNIIALPLAAGVLAPIGFILSPLVGAVVMSLSTIVVAINAMMLHD
ncbi:copper-translocating P-type ATPase [Dellaglioa sp. P0083]|uniref:copper-translocating P-type ATPase n=1 Tax=Dellaglioa kimchii TaxID=3344667 RepID=UPI0038D4F0F3